MALVQFPPAATGEAWTLVTNGSTTSGAGLSITGLGSYDKYRLIWIGIVQSGNANIVTRFNATASGYYRAGFRTTSIYQSDNASDAIENIPTSAVTAGFIDLTITGCKSTTAYKRYEWVYSKDAGGVGAGMWENTNSITSIDFTTGTGNFTAGTYRLYGSN